MTRMPRAGIERCRSGVCRAAGRGPDATRRAAGPVGATVTPEQGAEQNRRTEHHGLQWSWHRENRLGVAVPERDVGKIDERRPVLRSGIHDLEDRLEIAIQVDCRLHPALECQRDVSLVPPPMGDAAGETQGLTRADLDPFFTELGGEGARGHPSLFVLEVVNVARRPLLVWRQGASKLQHPDPVPDRSADLEDFTRMPVDQLESISGGWVHGERVKW